jgi:hypothetical protein
MLTLEELPKYFETLEEVQNTPFYRAIENGPYIALNDPKLLQKIKY